MGGRERWGRLCYYDPFVFVYFSRAGSNSHLHAPYGRLSAEVEVPVAGRGGHRSVCDEAHLSEQRGGGVQYSIDRHFLLCWHLESN